MKVSLFQSKAVRSATRAHRSPVLRWLTHLGPLGLFMVAIVDSSIVPMPVPGSTDLVLLWLVSHRGNPVLLVPIAIAGSLIGGYSSWHLGNKGGEAALKKYVPRRLLEPITGWAEHHPGLAVFLPAVLPPPIPLSPFLLAAGALSVSWRRFLLAFGAARTIRYILIAWLAVVYGRRVTRLWSGTLEKWSGPLIWTFVALMVGGAGYGIWKFRRQDAPRSDGPGLATPATETE